MENNKSLHHPFGPSSLKRRFVCPGSYAIEEALSDFYTSNELSIRGTRIHGIVENMLNGVSVAEDADLQEVELARKCVEFINGTIDVSEYEIFTERKVELNDFSGCVLFGTCDVLAVHKTRNELVIFDWKTGNIAVDEAEVNWQGLAYALCAMTEFQGYDCQVFFYNPVINQITDCVVQDSGKGKTAKQLIATQIYGIIEDCKDKNAIRVCNEDACRYCKGALAGTCPEYLAHSKALSGIADNAKITEWSDDVLSQWYSIAKIASKVRVLIEDELSRRIMENGKCGSFAFKTTKGGLEVSDLNMLAGCLEGRMSDKEILDCASVSVSKLEKAFAKKFKESGEFDTLKEAQGMFKNLIASAVNEKSERKSIVEIKE